MAELCYDTPHGKAARFISFGGSMALIHCPDCGNEISDLAPSCPQCGRPRDTPTPQRHNTVYVGACAVHVCLCSISRCFESLSSSRSQIVGRYPARQDIPGVAYLLYLRVRRPANTRRETG
jgi:hypothetical protein